MDNDRSPKRRTVSRANMLGRGEKVNVIPLAAATLLVGGAAVYGAAHERLGRYAAAQRAFTFGGWAAIILGSLGLVVELGPIGGGLLAVSVLGLAWVACALLAPVSARAAGLLTVCAATALLVWGVAG